MKEFDESETYKIGVLKSRGSTLNNPIWSSNAMVVYGSELHKVHKTKTDQEFFTKNPLHLKPGVLYTIYSLNNGMQTYFSEGTPRQNDSSGLGNIPQPHQEKSLLAQQRAEAQRAKYDNDATAMLILKEQLENKDQFINENRRYYEGQIQQLNDRITDLVNENITLAAKCAKLQEEVYRNEILLQKEQELQKEYKEDVKTEAKKIAKEEGMGGISELLMGLTQLAPLIMGNKSEPQMNVPPPTMPPPPSTAPVITMPQPQQQLNGVHNV